MILGIVRAEGFGLGAWRRDEQRTINGWIQELSKNQKMVAAEAGSRALLE